MRDRRYFGEDYMKYREERIKRFQQNRQRSRRIFGIVVAVAGLAFLLRAMGLLPNIDLEFSWPVILIVIGLFIGLKKNFHSNAWWILIVIGAANLIPQFPLWGHSSAHFVWPVFVIVLGLAIAFRPRRDRCYPMRGGGRSLDTNVTGDDSLNLDISFGARKEIVTSKDFKGGLVSVTFGGCEMNLTQADMPANAVAVLDCRVSFGGLEMVVPSHWEIQNEINPSFGSVEDARVVQTPVSADNKKTLILRGTCSFGSIELKSY
jgi:Domain of unknown function (DUF5668)